MTWIRPALAAIWMMLASGAFAAEATDFTLRDINNQEVSLSQFQGKVVVMSFWATWCGPCKLEMPHLQKMYEELGPQGLVVLSISIDDARDAAKVKPEIMKNGYTFPVLLDKESKVAQVYDPQATVPYTVVIGRDRQVVATHSGYNPGDEVKLREEVVGLLAK